MNNPTVVSRGRHGIARGNGDDHRLGRFMTHDFADYHIPVNADIPEIDVIFVDERDTEVSPPGVKGVGEIGVAR